MPIPPAVELRANIWWKNFMGCWSCCKSMVTFLSHVTVCELFVHILFMTPSTNNNNFSLSISKREPRSALQHIESKKCITFQTSSTFSPPETSPSDSELQFRRCPCERSMFVLSVGSYHRLKRFTNLLSATWSLTNNQNVPQSYRSARGLNHSVLCKTFKSRTHCLQITTHLLRNSVLWQQREAPILQRSDFLLL